MNNEDKIHLGVYGICIKDNQVLMIRKSRGPYTGLLDLPGGRLEFHETIEQGLRREIKEETSGEMLASRFLSNNEYICTYKKNGFSQPFHHIGLYYLVDLAIDALLESSDGEDSMGALWIDVNDFKADAIAPIAYPMLLRAFEEI